MSNGGTANVNRPTLTDVMLGAHRLSLNNHLSPPLFSFFWGLIMTANALKPRFKNPFDLTVNQAIGIGGGNSRQAVWTRQQQLKKIRIDGQWLIKIKCGNRQKNVPAKYEINYNLLIPPAVVIPEFEYDQSKIIDGTVDASIDASVDTSATDPLTILRSEEKREEQIPPNPQNDDTKHTSSSENEEGVVAPLDEEDRTIVKVKHVQDLILRKWKHQIKKPPDIGAVKDALREIGDHKPIVIAITKAANQLNTPTPSAALNLVMAIARKEGGNGGVSQEQLAAREREIKEMEAELKEAMGAEDEAAASQLEYLIGQKKESLERLRGGE